MSSVITRRQADVRTSQDNALTSCPVHTDDEQLISPAGKTAAEPGTVIAESNAPSSTEITDNKSTREQAVTGGVKPTSSVRRAAAERKTARAASSTSTSPGVPAKQDQQMKDKQLRTTDDRTTSSAWRPAAELTTASAESTVTSLSGVPRERPPTDKLLSAPDEEVKGAEETKPTVMKRRRRRLRRGRYIPPLASTNVSDLLPEGQWTPVYLAEQQQADPDIQPVLLWKADESLKPDWSDIRGCSPATKAYWQQFDSLVMKNGVLYRVFIAGGGRPDIHQFIAPVTLQSTLLELAHADAAGHLAVKKTAGQLQGRAYWYNWKTAVQLYCKNCDVCNAYHRGVVPKQGKLHPFHVGAPNERWSIDLTGEHPKSANGYVYILTAMDCFTKYVVCVPLRNKLATTVAKAIVEKIFLQFGLTELHTDGGGEFCNEVLSEICRLAGVVKTTTTPYKPSSNPVERFHRTMHMLLAKVISQHQRDWDSYLPYIAFCYNTSIHSGTSYTPYFLMHGSEARWNIDLLLDSEVNAKSANEHAASVSTRLAEAYRLTRENLGTAAVYSKAWYDQRASGRQYSEGESVRVLNSKGY